MCKRGVLALPFLYLYMGGINMAAAIMGIIAIIFIIMATIFLRNTVVPKLLKLSGYIMAFVAAFMPVYTLTIMGESFDINAITLIKGLSINPEALNNIDIKSSYFYIVLFVLPVVSIAVTLIKDNKIFNISTAVLSLMGIFASCLMIFKQLEIGSIIKISINVGIVVMLISYGVSLAISIIKIYSYINIEEKKPIEPVDIGEENIEDYFRNSETTVCPACGQRNNWDCNYCKKCGMGLKGE